MSVYRQVYTTFWTDPEVLDWGPDEKYFYLYLLTNPKTTQCGIYQISKKVIALETGYPIDRVSILLAYFIDRDKIAFSEATNELALKNWLKYNPDTSPKIKSCVDKQLAQVKNTLLIGYVRGIEGVSVKIREDNNKEKDNDKENIPDSAVASPTQKVSKHKHGEYKNVLLTDSELEKLQGEYNGKTDGIIQHFSELKAMKGYTYKSDYLAIKKWGADAYLEKNKQPETTDERVARQLREIGL